MGWTFCLALFQLQGNPDSNVGWTQRWYCRPNVGPTLAQPILLARNLSSWQESYVTQVSHLIWTNLRPWLELNFSSMTTEVFHASLNWVTSGSDTGLSPVRHQIITCTGADILPIRLFHLVYSGLIKYYCIMCIFSLVLRFHYVCSIVFDHMHAFVGD